MFKDLELLVMDLYGVEVSIVPFNNQSIKSTKGFIKSREEANIIYLNVAHSFKSNEDVVSTVIHEARHIWQKVNGVLAWFDKTYDDENFNKYWNDPVEVDARWAQEQYAKGNHAALKMLSNGLFFELSFTDYSGDIAIYREESTDDLLDELIIDELIIDADDLIA